VDGDEGREGKLMGVVVDMWMGVELGVGEIGIQEGNWMWCVEMGTELNGRGREWRKKLKM